MYSDDELLELQESLPVSNDDTTYRAFMPAHRQPFITFRLARDDYRAKSYLHLFEVISDGEDGKEIGLVFATTVVKINGRNLQELAEHLQSHKVKFVQVFDAGRWEEPADHKKAVITSISYEEPQKEPAKD